MNEFDSWLEEFEIRELLDLAHSSFDGGQYADVEQLVEEVLRHLGEPHLDNLPERIEARVLLGSAQLLQGKDIEDAFENFMWITSLVNNADYSSLFREDNISLSNVVEAFGKLIDCGSFLPDIALEDLFRTIDEGINWLEQIGRMEWLAAFRLRKGLLFLHQYKKEQALQELEATLALGYRYPEFIHLVECKITLAEALYISPLPDFERSLRLLEEALEEAEYPDELCRVYLLKAKVLREKNLRQRDFDEAFIAAQEAVEIARTLQANPYLSDAYVERSRISFEMEHYQDAVADLNEAERFYVSGSTIFASRGGLYMQMERYEEALADLNHAIELEEAEPWSLGQRGSLYVRMERYEEALADLNHAIELGGADPDPWIISWRGNCYLLLERYEEALADLNRAIELGGADPDPWTLGQRGELFLLRGSYQEALTDLNQAVALGTKGSDWRFYVRARVYRQLGQSELSNEDIQTAIQLLQTEKKNGTVYWWKNFNLALYTLFHGEDVSAQAQYEQLIATCPSAIPLQEARRDLKDVLELQPQHQLARQLRQQMNERIAVLQQTAHS
ncbi:hypothetical protein KSF_093480 [Reticulibacter mediterranei]|uniref:Tetratricopeptide repeat protein n=1 Tax=Reticulibacter mediterranei TaxID=2778369 RepID=A0A8J3IYU9_9CHLR|nr:tetratricopeptide repeat protein [Reticulibacter mediterranei]GHO99300.1 hypothetical protein KSF_093480 [Reticulibacter mediterranei]